MQARYVPHFQDGRPRPWPVLRWAIYHDLFPHRDRSKGSELPHASTDTASSNRLEARTSQRTISPNRDKPDVRCSRGGELRRCVSNLVVLWATDGGVVGQGYGEQGASL